MRQVENNITAALDSLGRQHPFVVFDVMYSAAERSALNALKIETTKSYDNFGNLEKLTHEVTSFIGSLGNNSNEISHLIANLVKTLVSDVVTVFIKETAWVAIRSSVATSFWDMPRWHSDGYYYYSSNMNEQYKIAITLKGPSTLFYSMSGELRKKFNTLRFDPKNREIIARMLDKSNIADIELTFPLQLDHFLVEVNHMPLPLQIRKVACNLTSCEVEYDCNVLSIFRFLHVLRLTF